MERCDARYPARAAVLKTAGDINGQNGILDVHDVRTKPLYLGLDMPAGFHIPYGLESGPDRGEVQIIGCWQRILFYGVARAVQQFGLVCEHFHGATKSGVVIVQLEDAHWP